VIPLDGNMSIRVAVILGFALGVLFGGIGAYILLGRHGDSAKLRAELNDLRERFSDYRDQVTRHFMRTSELVHEMTRSYRAIHEHLATGARELCNGETEGESLDTRDEDRLVDGGGLSDEADSDDLFGDTPRISDLRIGVESENNQPRRH
jgi:uncharacterized membrane-anchored protein YhcB (DUF1043 family)